MSADVALVTQIGEVNTAAAVARFSPDALLVLGRDMQIRWCNEAMERLTGWSTDQVVGRSVLEFLPPAEVADAAEAVIVQAENKTRNRPAEFHIRTADGGLVAVEAMSKPAFDDENVGGLVVSLRHLAARGVTDIERRSLERLLALTATQCVTGSVHTTHQVVTQAIERYRETLRADVVAFVVAPNSPDMLGGFTVIDGDATVWNRVSPKLQQRVDEIDAPVQFSSTDDGAIARALRGLGLRGALVIPVDGGTGRMCALWKDQAPGSAGYYFLHAGFVGMLVNTIRRADAHELAETLARIDPLTGLANRAQLWVHATRPVTGNHAALHPVVLYADLDGFKSINDRFGHDVGDAVLVETARRLGSCIRDSDLAVRLGGDEFAIIAFTNDASAANHLRSRVETAIALPYRIDGVTLTLRASLGLVVGNPGDELSDLLKWADAAMYADKKHRRVVPVVV